MKKNNKVELNFNGETTETDAVMLGFCINRTVAAVDSAENEINVFNEEYVSRVMEILESFFRDVLGDSADRCMEAAFGGSEVGYYDMIDLYNYIRSEFNAFIKTKTL